MSGLERGEVRRVKRLLGINAQGDHRAGKYSSATQ